MTIEDDEVFSLTPKGIELLKRFDKHFLEAWKEGHTECECEKIALRKLNHEDFGT